MKIKKFLFFLLIISFVPGISWQKSAAQTQPDIQLSAVEVSILPEFNQPSVFVIYEIALAEETPLPTELVFHVPTDVQSLTVANQSENDLLNPLEFEVTQIGHWKEIRFTTATQSIRIEYYDPKLIKEGDIRSYTFQFLPSYTIDNLTITVRQPFGASDIHTEPPLNQKADLGAAFDYYSTNLSNISTGELFSLALTYTINSEMLAYPVRAVEPAQPIDETTPGKTPSPFSVVWWLLTIALAMIVFVGSYYFWYRVNILDKRERMVKGVGIMNPEKQAVFCHECGKRSRPGDSYCSNCGTELRKALTNNHPL